MESDYLTLLDLPLPHEWRDSAIRSLCRELLGVVGIGMQVHT
jgi:hypothetical protein